MSPEQESPTKGNRPEDVYRDPDEADLEIDQANDKMGGPTTASHSAGLATPLQPGGTTPSGGPAATGTSEADKAR